MYEEQRENQGNNLLGGVVLGAGLLAGGLGARSLLKNRIRKANISVDPPTPTGSTTNNQARRSGQGGIQVVDLPRLPGQGGTSYQSPRKSRYESSDAALKKFTQDIEGGSLGADYRPTSGPVVGENVGKTWQMNRDYYQAQQEGLDLLTDPRTGEIYRRGGSQSVNQIISTPRNQGGGINLSKQNLSGPGVLTTEQMMSFGEPKTRSDVDYVRGRIAKSLEAPVGNVGAGVELRQLPPASSVDSDMGRINRLLKDLQSDVKREAGQMSGVESSRQSAVVKRLEKQEEQQAKGILRDFAAERFAQAPKQEPTARPPGAGPKLSGYSEGPIDKADRVAINAARQDKPQTLVEVRNSGRPIMRTARNEAVQTANDQKDIEIIQYIQRNEDIDLTKFNEDILDKRVADAQDFLRNKQIQSEVDLNFNYSAEENRQAADVGAALERIQNDPKRVAAENIISELQAAGRAERDFARLKKENPELPGVKAIDNARQREGLGKSQEVTGEDITQLLTGEAQTVDSNIRGRALRGGKINEEGNYYTKAGNITYPPAGGPSTTPGRVFRGKRISNRLRESPSEYYSADTGIRTDIRERASVPGTPEQMASIMASEEIRKAQAAVDAGRASPLKTKTTTVDDGDGNITRETVVVPTRGPEQDVANSMKVMRAGMEVEPREPLPSLSVPRVYDTGFENDQLAVEVPVGTAFTGAAADAAGPVSRLQGEKGENITGSLGGVVFDPEVAAYNERMAQGFLQRAISGGMAQKQPQAVEVFKTPRLVGPAEVGPARVPLSRSAASPPRVALVDTGYAIPGSASVGTPSTGAMTISLDPAASRLIAGGDIDSSRDIGRVRYTGPVQTSAERLALATGGTARPMSILPDRGDGRTTISIQPPAYDPRYKTAGARVEKYPVPETPTRTVYRDPNTGATFAPLDPPKPFELKGPAPIAPDAGPVRLSVGQDPQGNYAPQALAGRIPQRSYPRMRGNSLFPTGTLINDPEKRGGPVKFEGRERRENEYVRPISERLGRGNTMERFPIIRRG